MRPSRTGGFSLLEILVVVTLFGLVAAMVIPNLAGPRGASLSDAAEQIEGRLSLLAERSLVRGEVLAVRLDPHRLQLLRYSVEERGFVPLSDKAAAQVTLPDAIRLEWKLDEEQEGTDLAEVVESRLLDSGDGAANGSVDEADRPDADETEGEQDKEKERETIDEVPQLFFFPSGEATALTLWIRDADSESEVRLELDALGNVKRPQPDGGESNE